MQSGSPETRKSKGALSPKTQATPEKSVYKFEERNPYKFIEKTLVEARGKLEKMKGTPQLLETLSDVLLDWVYTIE